MYDFNQLKTNVFDSKYLKAFFNFHIDQKQNWGPTEFNFSTVFAYEKKTLMKALVHMFLIL